MLLSDLNVWLLYCYMFSDVNPRHKYRCDIKVMSRETEEIELRRNWVQYWSFYSISCQKDH